MNEKVTPHPPTNRSDRPSDRLDSWKEIAAYLDREVRTVQRWEKIEGLPVHRHVHERLSSVYAYESELKEWWENRKPRLESQRETREAARRWGINARQLIIGGIFIALVTAGYILLPRLLTPDNRTAGGRKMLAVMPFENLGSADDESFADGVTEEITVRLASMQGLGVISRMSVLEYKDTEKSLSQIGDELGIDYILEGTVRWQHSPEGTGRVRVTPQLIRVADGAHLWAHVYDEPLDEVFQVQSDIARRVAEELDVMLLDVDHATRSNTTDNFEAYTHYLGGRTHRLRLDSRKDIKDAERDLLNAVALDPSFARAWTDLALTHGLVYEYFDTSDERKEKMKRAVDKALELQPGLPEGHIALGHYYLLIRDHVRALEQFSIAQKRQPNNIDLLVGLAVAAGGQGDRRQALEYLKKAYEVNPRSADLAWELASTYQGQDDFEEAEQYYDRAISLAADPDYYYGMKAWMYVQWRGDIEKARETLESIKSEEALGHHLYMQIQIDIVDEEYESALDRLSTAPDELVSPFTPLHRVQLIADVYSFMGRPELALAYYDSARVLLESKVEEQPKNARLHSVLGMAYAGLGQKEEAIEHGKHALDLRGYRRARRADLARIYIMIGEYDAAIEHLERVVGFPTGLAVALLRIEPRWSPLREHPGYQKLLEKHSEN